jgi:ABC-type cobalt transport system substrate-binding protein
MAIRLITVSKVVFDDNWRQGYYDNYGQKKQDEISSMVPMYSTSDKATIKILVSGETHPKKLMFKMNVHVFVGAGMIMYDVGYRQGGSLENLPIGNLDDEL